MKQPKKLTRSQKILLGKNKLNSDNWLCVKEDKDELVVQNRESKKIRVIKKGA